MQAAPKIFLPEFDVDLNNLLGQKGNIKTFGAGQQVFAEGDAATFLPIVLIGQVKLVRYPQVGKEVILGTFAAGDMFAIPPALDGKTFPATAIAVNESRLFFLPRNEFLTLMDSSPEFSVVVMNRMCGLLRSRTETVQILATPSAEHRVAGVLLQLAGNVANGESRKITQRRQDIAEMSGLTLETTIRSIRKLADRGFFKIVRGKVVLETTQHLRDFVR